MLNFMGINCSNFTKCSALQSSGISDPVNDATYKDIWMATAKVKKNKNISNSKVYLGNTPCYAYKVQQFFVFFYFFPDFIV